MRIEPKLMKAMNESVKFKFLSLFCLIFVLMGVAASAHAEAIPNVKNLQLGYSVYLGGIHAMDGKATFTRIGNTYKIKMKTGTQGFLRNLAPWDADLTSTGRLRNSQVQPTRGDVVTYWKDKPYSVNFVFKGKKGVEAQFIPAEWNNNNEPVPDALKRGVLDPLSGVVQIMSNFAYGGGCDQTIPIYDGHRRFNLRLSDSGYETLDGEDYSVFSGSASRCKVDFDMLAGTRKDREGSKFWEDGNSKKSNRPPVYIFLAKVRDDLPELPVRAETSTVFGGIVVHLNEVSGGKGPHLVVNN